jgi:hypothetical protein
VDTGAAGTPRGGSGSRLKRVWKESSVPFWIGASRVGIGVVFAHLVIVLLPQSRQHYPGGSLSAGTWLGAFDRWDSAYYVGIAQHGYPLQDTQHTAFFPGYPALISLVHSLTFDTLSYLDSAMVVSWLAFVAASILLYRLVTKLYGQRVGLIATVLFCWFPASLFFLSPYSEALFTLEIIAVLSLIVGGQFLAASCVAAFASATSPESIALTIALIVASLMAGRGVVRTVGFGAISGIGLAGYAGFLWSRFHHPFEFISVQKYWMRSEHWPFVGLYRNVLALRHYLVGPGPAPGGTSVTFTNIRWVWLLDDSALVLSTILFVALAAMWWRRSRTRALNGAPGEPVLGTPAGPIPLSFLIVTFVIVLLAACTTISPYALPSYASSEGEARFVGIALPLYVSGALLIRRHAALVCFAVAGSVAIALLFQALYNLGYWVT